MPSRFKVRLFAAGSDAVHSQDLHSLNKMWDLVFPIDTCQIQHFGFVSEGNMMPFIRRLPNSWLHLKMCNLETLLDTDIMIKFLPQPQ